MKKIISIAAFCILSATISLAQNTTTLPTSITFERTVVQQSNEKKAATVTYYFTISGDYAMMKESKNGSEEATTVIYTKDGKMAMIDEDEKTITIMNMPKMVGEGGQMGKDMAEKIKKQPIQKDAEDKMTVTKTNKTKTICGYTAYAYDIKNDDGSSKWWYAKVDFDPIKIYTMGAGNAALAAKTKNKDDEFKNNPMAIPVLNKNYLMAEIEYQDKKGLETKSITKTNYVFSTAGYTVKDFGKMGLKEMIKSKLKNGK